MKDKSTIILLSFLLFGVILVILGNTTFKSHTFLEVSITSLGVNFIASGIFTAIYNAFVNETLIKTITTSIDLATQNSISSNFQTLFSYIPTKVFEATNVISADFDIDVKEELDKSSHCYYFRGVSGIKSVNRVSNSQTTFREIRFILTDLTDLDALKQRARVLLRVNKNTASEQEIKDTVKFIKNETIASIIGLYTACLPVCYEIEIVFKRGASNSRLEIFDESIYISTYNDSSTNYRYEKTIKYPFKSYFYTFFLSSFNKEFNECKQQKSLNLNAIHSIEELVSKLNGIGILEITLNNYQEFERSYNQQRSIT